MPPDASSIPLASAGLSTRTYLRLTWLFSHQRTVPLPERADHPDDAAYKAARDARLAEWDGIAGALTLADLAAVTEAELLTVPSFGLGCLAELKATLARHGLALAG
jgi:hypothetical protein